MGKYKVQVDKMVSNIWTTEGRFHREDGPAIVHIDRTRSWYLNGKRHRECGPAVEWDCGTEHWHLNDEWLGKEEHAKRMSDG